MTQRGSTPLELALGVFLLVVPVTMLVLALAPWAEHRNLVRRAAAEAARVIALDPRTGVGEAAALVSRQAEALGVEGVTMGVCGSPLRSPGAVDAGACSGVGRGGLVVVVVEAEVPALNTPVAVVGGMRVRAEHAEQVDPYRSFP